MPRVVFELPLEALYVDHLPINPDTFLLAKHLWARGEIPPIKVHCDPHGRYRVTDGRHRVAAAKLVGFTHLSVKMAEKHVIC